MLKKLFIELLKKAAIIFFIFNAVLAFGNMTIFDLF